MAARAADLAGELREHEAPVGEAGQRVLEQDRLEPLRLGDDLLLESLRAPGGVHAQEQLGVEHRLDEDVLGAVLERLDRPLERRRPLLDQEHGGAERIRVGLDPVEQPAPGLGVHHGHVRLPLAAAVERVARGAALGHLVARLRQHPLEATPLTLPPMGHDNSHVRQTNTPSVCN